MDLNYSEDIDYNNLNKVKLILNKWGNLKLENY